MASERLSRLLAALADLGSPLALFAAVVPKDPARVVARDVAYGPGPRQTLDAYAPKGEPRGGAPVAIFLYGGSWDSGRRQDYGWAGRALAAQGFLALVPDYRLFPNLYPGFLEDGAQAVRWAVDNAARLGGDPERVVLIGHSAGAYNAAMLALDRRWLTSVGVDPAVVKAWAGLSGPYDFLPLDSPITRRTFGQAEDLPATQPALHARADAPPAFLASGDPDVTVKPRHTRRLGKALGEAGARVEVRLYPGLGHAGPLLALSRPMRRKAPVLAEMTAFLKSALA